MNNSYAYFNAMSIQVRFQATDIRASNSTAVSTAASTAAVNAVAHGLSTGTKAGIGAGVALVAVILIGCGIWILWRKKWSPQGASVITEYANDPNEQDQRSRDDEDTYLGLKPELEGKLN
jgi:uncharacterized protein HemX